MRQPLVYIVDDEELVRQGIALALEDFCQVRAFATAEEALARRDEEPPDLVLLDVGLPGMSGIEALAAFRRQDPELAVVMITAYEDVATVVAAMKEGAHDYVVKPLQMDGLLATIRHALDGIRLRQEVRALQERYLNENLPCFIGESESIQDVMEFVRMVAKSPDTPILILGETGTGKELVAGAIHYRSPHFQGPLVAVNCASIPAELTESELFGYERGAFSGAAPAGKRGLVEEAADGTLFLDEVAELSPSAQAKLLRFLECGEFYRVGGTSPVRVRTRVVSATNRELEALMAENRFRKDLYFRLGVVTVRLPCLNERQEDILPLAHHFLLAFGQKFGKRIMGLDAQAREALLAHRWTGNVRELRNRIERGVLVARGETLTAADLGLAMAARGGQAAGKTAEPSLPALTPDGLDLEVLLRRIESRYLAEALALAGGNESRAARLLRINHHTFRYRRKKLLAP